MNGISPNEFYKFLHHVRKTVRDRKHLTDAKERKENKRVDFVSNLDLISFMHGLLQND